MAFDFRKGQSWHGIGPTYDVTLAVIEDVLTEVGVGTIFGSLIGVDS